MSLPGDTAVLTQIPILHENGEVTLSMRYEQLGGAVQFDGQWRGRDETWREVRSGQRAERGIQDALARFHLRIKGIVEERGVAALNSEIEADLTRRQADEPRKADPLQTFFLWFTILMVAGAGMAAIALF